MNAIPLGSQQINSKYRNVSDSTSHSRSHNWTLIDNQYIWDELIMAMVSTNQRKHWENHERHIVKKETISWSTKPPLSGWTCPRSDNIKRCTTRVRKYDRMSSPRETRGLLRIQDVSGKNLGPDTGYDKRCFPWFSSVPQGECHDNTSN